MTPFGQKLRELRHQHGRQLKDMAKALRVSSAYLSALEHGHRARPKAGFVQQVAAFFNLAWDEVDELKALADLSDPKISIETGGLSPLATELANRLAKRIGELEPALLHDLNERLKQS
ncbi:MAG: helix-turn-helix domain-containing protein [Rhodospirillaceae bacterium]|nr:helix-turn-helix domain-containing protein [Rhodospirillaceae bacterium]